MGTACWRAVSGLLSASRAFVAAGSLLAWAPCGAAETTSVKPVMLEAIDAPDGRASGILVGPMADKFSGTTGSSAPVVVEVTTLKRFRQEGCKRLNVRLKQENVPTRDGKTAEFWMDYGLNLCRDGSAPVEGMDLEKAGKALDPGGTNQGIGMGGQPFARP